MRQIAVDEKGVVGRASILMHSHSPVLAEEGKLLDYLTLVALVLR